MKVFLIIVAVLAVIIIAVLSLSATVTLVYDKGWSTKLQVLFIEKDIVLSKILSFILFPEKKAQEVADKEEKKKDKGKETYSEKISEEAVKLEEKSLDADIDAEKTEKVKADETSNEEKGEQTKPAKPNPIKQLWDRDGILGILDLITNLLDSANNAVITLIKGLHIYSLYVMILVGGGDADVIARNYGRLCKYYYPLKGMILNGMRVDNYDDYIQPDFIADKTEVEFQLIASINVGLLVKVALKAGFIFLKNLISNKKSKKGDR